MSQQPVTLFFDGACPLCQREIALLKRLDGERGRLAFEDVSPDDAAPTCPIDRATLLARMHARLPNGEIVEGARAFTEAWGRLRGLGWLRPLGQFAPTRWVLDRLYSLFLRVRPRLQRLAKR